MNLSAAPFGTFFPPKMLILAFSQIATFSDFRAHCKLLLPDNLYTIMRIANV